MSKPMSKKPSTNDVEPILVEARLSEQAYAAPVIVAAKEDVVGKRIEQQRAQRDAARRDRGPSDITELSLKLSVPEVLKDKRLTYRWVNDKATRVYQMQQKGWQVADDTTIAADSRNSGVGSKVERVVNERTTPTVEKGFLMWKPKEFYEEDKAKEQAAIKEREAGLKRGDTRDPQGLSGPESYIPAGGIKIE